jgi:hypothetical protein
MNKHLAFSLASFGIGLALVVSANGCSSSKDTSTGGTQPPSSSEAGGPAPGPADAASPTTTDANTPSDAGNEAGPTVTLTLKNYVNWCSVTVNGGTPSTADQTLQFAPGTVVVLHGQEANASFVWGYWRGTDGDTSASHDTSQGTMVTMTADKTVQACCPTTAAPTTPCPDP